MKINGIIFDFGNVICSFENGIFISRIAERCRYTDEEIRKILYEESEIVEDYESGRISSNEFYEKTQDLLDLDMDIEDFRKSFTDIFTPIDATIDLIKELKKRGYKLGLLSNTNEWDHEHAIKKVDVYPLFDAVSVSYQLGVKKPDERIYRDCLRKIGLRPSECIYIDDIDEYVKKAESMGMNGIYLKEPGELRHHMEALYNSTKTYL